MLNADPGPARFLGTNPAFLSLLDRLGLPRVKRTA